MSENEEDFYYDRNMFFKELSQSIERNKLSTNALFSNYLNDFKDIVQHNGLVQEEMNIVCQLLCTVDLRLQNFKQILLTLVPEEPNIPSDVCEELIVFALSIYRKNSNDETKAQSILFWLLYVVEEKLTDMDVIDKYYKVLFHLCNYSNLNQPVAGIIYRLTNSVDVQKWMISCCHNSMEVFKSQSFMVKLISFFESPNLIHETRQKGLFDSNSKYCKELACGLRSVRKELMNLHPQTANSQQLTEYKQRTSDQFYTKVQFISINNKFELPSFKCVANEFSKNNFSKNSLSLLSNTSGWLHLLVNEDAVLNLQHRFSNNLFHSLDQIFFSNEISLTTSKKASLLQEILEFQKFAQRGLTAVNLFIFKYLHSWDGMEYARIIYELFEHLSFTSEEELKSNFLEKLYAIFITGDELIYRMVINSLTNLLCNLHLNSRQTMKHNSSILFGEKLRNETELEIIKCLTKYISDWCSLCIYHYPQEEPLKHTVYTFFEKVSVLENLKPHLWPLWTILPPNVFYNGLMSVNIYWLDRLAKLMLRYIENDTSRIEDLVDTPWIFKSLNTFNSYTADLYNSLKTGELFDKREEGFIFNQLSIEEVQKELKMVNLNLCFQLEKHIALAPYFMKAENSVKSSMDLLETEAPYLHTLILVLNEKLNNTVDDSSVY